MCPVARGMRFDEWQVFVRKLRQRIKRYQRQHRHVIQQRHQRQRWRQFVVDPEYWPDAELSVQPHQSCGHVGQFGYVR